MSNNSNNVIISFAEHIREHYLDTDIAGKVYQELIHRVSGERYSAKDYNKNLTEEVTNETRGLSGDSFISLNYDPDYIADLNHSEEYNSVPRFISDEANFGFERLQIFQGNIGYLKLTGFYDTKFALETAVLAMNFVQRTHSLIIDLRENGGGYTNMVQLLSSYLLGPEPFLVNSCHVRGNSDPEQHWTMPLPSHYRKKPVYILVGAATFSAAEMFAYTLQQYGRATIIGETTVGGANCGKVCVLNDECWAFIPNGKNIHPKSGTNWQGCGVIPDRVIKSELALEYAIEQARI